MRDDSNATHSPRALLALALVLGMITAGRASGQDVAAASTAHELRPPSTNSEHTSEPETEDDDDDDLDDILDADLASLAETPVSILDDVVTSVARNETPVRRTASAIYVVTPEMIRQSGATNIMDVLRTVPGVHVARISASNWAISVRGLSGRYANKLLVQIDGRAVYTPVLGATFWELLSVPLKDIASIEVIRGPGSSVWGSNAINGVINITTKSASETKGVYAQIGGGNERRLLSTLRLGGSLADNLHYRIYGMATKDGNGFLPTQTARDFREVQQGGFQLDWMPNASDQFMLQGGLLGDYRDRQTSGGKSSHLLARWNRQIDADTGFSLQTYYDSYKLHQDIALSGHAILDVEGVYRAVRGSHSWVMGLGFRQNEGRVDTTPDRVLMSPEKDRFRTFSFFVQDTITLADDFAFLTLGSKFEHNEYVGFVYQPGVRLAISPDSNTSLWTSISRSVRTPTILEKNLNSIVPTAMGLQLTTPSPRLTAEQALTYEIGMRRQTNKQFYWDLATYFKRSDDVMRRLTNSLGPPLILKSLVNAAMIDSYGFELSGSYEPTDWWSLRAAYSFDRQIPGGLPPEYAEMFERTNGGARNIAFLTSTMKLSADLSWYVGLRYVDSLKDRLTRAGVDSYIEVDTRLAYRFDNGMELAVVGQNLLDNAHQEFFSELGVTSFTEVQRSVHAMVSWEF